MSEDAYLKAEVAAMADALRRRDKVLTVIDGLDAPLGERLRSTMLSDADSIARLNSPNPQVLEAALSEGRRQLRELLGFCAAAAARASGLDHGLTRIAERWLDGLSHTMNLQKVALVVPSQDEFTDAQSSIVNLRMPFEGIWGLGVAAHEYGHFVAGHLLTRGAAVGGPMQTTAPVEAFLVRYEKQHRDGVPYYRLGHELFADAVAVLFAGPAFTHHCLHYRFDPARSDTSTRTHPGYARRMDVQLRTLQFMGESDPSVDRARALLDERWHAVTAGARMPATPLGDDGLDELADFAVSTACTNATLARARYRDHASAVRWAATGFTIGNEVRTHAHVLNAAWSARLSAPDAVTARQQIEATALTLLGRATGP